MVVVEASDVDWNDEQELDKMKEYVERGVNLVFSRMPDLELIKENEKIRSLLGIYSVQKAPWLEICPRDLHDSEYYLSVRYRHDFFESVQCAVRRFELSSQGNRSGTLTA